MAEKRMFAKSIVLSDAFLDMPMSARCLYFTLNMFADDDGFVGSPKGIMRHCGASQDDMLILLQKRFIISFESGVIVIKHWRINNILRSDRHKDTTYKEELATLMLDENGAYTEKKNLGIPNDNQVATNGLPSIDKDSIDKLSIDKNRVVVEATPTTSPMPNENDMFNTIIAKWNSIEHTNDIRSIIPGTQRYTETMICINMYGYVDVLNAIDKVRNSAYLKRRNRISYDHYINRNVIPKLLEGSYDTDFSHEETFEEKLARM